MATSNNESNHTMKLPFALFCSTVVLCLLASCSKPPLPGPQPHPVHGKIVYRGQPAKGFRVTFHTTMAWKGAQFRPSGMTDENGEYRLRSYQSDDGAPAGEYVVTFEWPQQLNTPDLDDAVQRTMDRLQGLYNNPKKSRFKAVVHEGNNEVDPFVLN
jgi:hypothetical protein